MPFVDLDSLAIYTWLLDHLSSWDAAAAIAQSVAAIAAVVVLWYNNMLLVQSKRQTATLVAQVHEESKSSRDQMKHLAHEREEASKALELSTRSYQESVRTRLNDLAPRVSVRTDGMQTSFEFDYRGDGPQSNLELKEITLNGQPCAAEEIPASLLDEYVVKIYLKVLVKNHGDVPALLHIGSHDGLQQSDEGYYTLEPSATREITLTLQNWAWYWRDKPRIDWQLLIVASDPWGNVNDTHTLDASGAPFARGGNALLVEHNAKLNTWGLAGIRRAYPGLGAPGS